MKRPRRVTYPALYPKEYVRSSQQMIKRRTEGHRQSSHEQEERQIKLNDRDRKAHQNAFKIITNQIYLNKQIYIYKPNY